MTVFYWIMEYVASFIEISMCCIFCGTFLEKEGVGGRKKIVLVWSGSGALLITLLSRMEIFSYINAVLTITIFFLIQLLVYRTRIGLSIFLTLIYSVILTALDFMISYFSAFVLDFDIKYLLATQSLGRVVWILLSKAILILIISTINRLFGKTMIFIKKYVVIMCIYSIFLLALIFTIVEVNMGNGNAETELLLTVFFVASIVIELLMFYFVIKTGEVDEQKQRAELIKLENSMLQKSLDETERAFNLWRNSVHDYKNNIITLTQFAYDGNLEAIREYLGRENELIDRKMFYIRTGSSVIDAIVNTKQSFAEERGITFVVNAIIPKNCSVSEIDIANILGNIIDNAIEASVAEEDPYIDLTVKQEKDIIVIKIINKYSKELLNGLKTTKHEMTFHGIGIRSVKNIIEKYEGVFSIKKQGDEVIVKILIPNLK